MAFLLLLWLIIRFVPLMIFIAFPVGAIFYYVFIAASFGYAFYLFLTSRRWLSFRRVLVMVFLIPVAVVIYAEIREEMKPRYAMPDKKLIESYIDREYFTSSESLDWNDLEVTYDKPTKELQLTLKTKANDFLAGLEYNFTAQTFLEHLYQEYIEIPRNLTKASRVPRSIALNGYWGDTRLFVAHFQKKGNHFQLVPPYPYLRLISSNNNWYLEYRDDNSGETNRLLIKEFKRSSEYQIDFFAAVAGEA